MTDEQTTQSDEQSQETAPNDEAVRPGADNASTDEPRGDWLSTLPATAQDEIRRLRSESKTHRLSARKLEQKVKEFEDQNKTEQQRLEERAVTAEGKAQTAEQQLARFKIAAEKGIPPQLVGRLQGSTPEELEADAEQLKQEFGLTDKGPETDFDAGARRSAAGSPKTMNGLIREAVGR